MSKMRLTYRSLAFFVNFLLWPIHSQASPPHYNPCGKTEYSYAGSDQLFEDSVAPGIPWPAWMDLLATHWSDKEIKATKLFEPEKINQAIAWVAPGGTTPPNFGHRVKEEVLKAGDRRHAGPYPPEDMRPFTPAEVMKRWTWERGRYEPLTAATSRQTEAYKKASDLYYGGEWAQAVTRFDEIARDKHSPYRAAAAYTAARASLLLGRYQDGVHRIDRLVTDPAFHEFQLAGLHLIGTLAYESGSPELIAAQYAEIENALQAPPELECRDTLLLDILSGTPEGEFREGGWKADLSEYLARAFPPNHFFATGTTRRDVLDVLAAHDPFFDLVRAVAAPTPFKAQSGWLSAEMVASSHNSGDPRENMLETALRDSRKITGHAREQWQKTKNPLWGYALAGRTADPADIPLLQDMLHSVPSLSRTPVLQYAQGAFRSYFIWHTARLMLMSSKTDEALNVLQQNPIDSTSHTEGYGLREDDARKLLNGGIRFFLEKFDLPGARRWASEAGAVFQGISIDPALRPLLAENMDEFFSGKVPGDGRDPWEGHIYSRYDAPTSVLDLWSAQSLLALAQRPGLEASQKRMLLSSAWMRSYLLDGLEVSLKLLPQLRQAFPEISTDIDEINEARLSQNKSHLLTHLLLKIPGFNFRPSWTRTKTAMRRKNPSIFAIDSYNPSDANWWCAADVNQIKIDMAKTFYLEPLGVFYYEEWDRLYSDPLLPQPPMYGSERTDEEYRKSMLALADKLIAWHPLLKEANLAELTRLSKVESGPRMLSEQAIAWAKGMNWLTRRFISDKYLPETLHLAVRSTRYGCRRDGGHGPYSREAHDLLQKLYPQSEWAKQTPFWYNAFWEEGPQKAMPETLKQAR